MTIRILAGWALGTLLVACAQAPKVAGEEVRDGRVTQIESVQVEGESQFGTGAVIGSVVGGVIGHQIGGGTGKDVATVVGVVAGGVAGSQIEKKSDMRPGQRITVELSNGVVVGFTQVAVPNLQVGDKVRIEGNGIDAHVVRADP